MDARKQARIDLAAVLRWSAKLELHEGVDNHFSVMVPGEDDRFLINPHRRHWRDIRASDLVEVDAEGNLIEGSEPPEATAFFIHWRIHVKCAHARCILHTHMPYATALTAIEGGRLEPIAQPALKFHNQIAYDDKYNGLALDANEGDRLADALFDKRIAFLANHGIIATGPTVAHAFNDLYYLERACMFQALARAQGGKLRSIPDSVREHTRQQMVTVVPEVADRHFTALRRILDQTEPGYRA